MYQRSSMAKIKNMTNFDLAAHVFTYSKWLLPKSASFGGAESQNFQYMHCSIFELDTAPMVQKLQIDLLYQLRSYEFYFMKGQRKFKTICSRTKLNTIILAFPKHFYVFQGPNYIADRSNLACRPPIENPCLAKQLETCTPSENIFNTLNMTIGSSL